VQVGEFVSMATAVVKQRLSVNPESSESMRFGTDFPHRLDPETYARSLARSRILFVYHIALILIAILAILATVQVVASVCIPDQLPAQGRGSFEAELPLLGARRRPRERDQGHHGQALDSAQGRRYTTRCHPRSNASYHVSRSTH